MNENLENQLAKVIEKSLSLAEKTGEFVIEQAPDLLREFYVWHISKYSIGIFLSFLLAFFVYRLSYLFGKKQPFEAIKDEGYSWSKRVNSEKYYGRYFIPDSDNKGGLIGFRIGSIVVFLMIFIPNLYGIIKITLAPKIYLIEYFIK